MRRILAMVLKDVSITFGDRNLLLIMLATPLAIALIIAFAFGGASGGQISLRNIPVAVVNLDEGGTVNGNSLAYGAILTNILAPDQATTSSDQISGCAVASSSTNQGSLDDLLAVTLLSDATEARNGVDNGDYSAAVIIPADYTQALNPEIGTGADDRIHTQIEVYQSSTQTISASVVASVVNGIHGRFVTGATTIQATLNELIEIAQSTPIFGMNFTLANLVNVFEPDFSCAFTSALNVITVDKAPVNETQQKSQFVQVLVAFGAAQAMFFALFSANATMLSIYVDRDQWTLQRMIVAPMPRIYILIGKLLSVMTIVFLQISTLFIAMTVVASMVEGQPQFIWGDYPILLIFFMLVITLSVSGLAVFIVGISRTAEQARLIGPLLFTGMAALGGAFGFALPVTLQQLSPIYWGVGAIEALAANQTDIILNVLVLGVQGVLMFMLGVYFFNRRSIV